MVRCGVGDWQLRTLRLSLDDKGDSDDRPVFDNLVPFHLCGQPFHVRRLDALDSLRRLGDRVCSSLFPAIGGTSYQFDYLCDSHVLELLELYLWLNTIMLFCRRASQTEKRQKCGWSGRERGTIRCFSSGQWSATVTVYKATGMAHGDGSKHIRAEILCGSRSGASGQMRSAHAVFSHSFQFCRSFCKPIPVND